MEDLRDFLRRAAEGTGFSRDYYVEMNLPTNPANVVVVHSFGDMRSECVLSSLLLRRFKEELRGSKYMILCSWKGHRGLFPYADEYWSPRDASASDLLVRGALGFENTSDVYLSQRRNLNFFFPSLITPDDFKILYDGGITGAFRERLGVIRRFMPMIPSASYLDVYFNQEMMNRPGVKVLLMPMRRCRAYLSGRLESIGSRREFWQALVRRLSGSGFCPVVVQNCMTHDLSGSLNDRAIFVQEEDVTKIMGMMRVVGCVLDVFDGTSRLAISARTPFLAVDGRARYATEREFEIDDICARDIPKRYIFSFPTIIEGGDPSSWDGSLFDNVVAKLNSFVPGIDRNSLPSTSEGVEEVPFSVVRDIRAKKLGTKFVRLPKD